MPYCTQCGTQVAAVDAYCAQCGARQQTQAAGGNWLSARTASILCYVPGMGWIAAVFVLAAHKFKGNQLARFHAFQGLYLFAAWLAVSWIIRPMGIGLPGHFVHLLQAILLAVSIFMMVKASHDEAYVLPVIGELAQRSAIEH